MDYTKIEKTLDDIMDASKDSNSLNTKLKDDILDSNSGNFGVLNEKLDSLKGDMDTDYETISGAIEKMKKVEENVRNGVV